MDKIEARKIAINSQLLSALKNTDVLSVVKHLGYVQLDTISVIARAHHHTLWTRIPDYKPQMLLDLLSKDRTVFEFWGHAAAYLPMEDYRFYISRMNIFPTNKWHENMNNNSLIIQEAVLEKIRAEGPLKSSDFENNEKRGTWWDWKPAKVALECLYNKGELMVTAREKFQKVYDLRERVLPDWVDTTMPTREELCEFLVKTAVRAHGIINAKQIKEHIPEMNLAETTHTIKNLLEGDELVAVQIENAKKEYYAFPQTLEINFEKHSHIH